MRRPHRGDLAIEPPQRRAMVGLAAVANPQVEPGRLHRSDRASVAAREREDADLRTAVAQDVGDRRYRQRRAAALDRVDDVGDADHVGSRRAIASAKTSR